MKKPGYVLDSFAVLAYFQAETGGIKVKDILKKASSGKALAFLSVLNLGEIIYITERRLGRDTAESTLGDILRLPIQLAEAGMDRVLDAAHIKAHHAISYADAFAVSLARELNATIVTADPEFKKVQSLANILWL
ncbi:MAG: type II toxin-antitoxin system VapC family toxin [Deltaproteobacteria bacterium]|nr:type II toxin-antitoxin system VapC family toxin [Deltaproteobacteria bacterium]